MNERERYLETLLFGTPDKVPFSPGGPRESTLAAWRTQGLPDGADWHAHLCSTLGIPREPARTPRVNLGVSFIMIPEFEEKMLERRGDSLVVQDWKGNVCEISSRYDVTYLRSAKDFVTRRWIRCPVESRDDWDSMKKRYDPQGPGRFPADFEERCRKARGRDWPLCISVNGPFWQLREWCGFEGLCMLMLDDPAFVLEMADFWRDFVLRTMRPILDRVDLDFVQLSEDMAYKEHSMISPTMARRFLLPAYRAWEREIKASGCRIIDMDSDGHVGELIPIWLDAGFNCCAPMEVAAGNDIVAYRRTYGRRMAYRGGIDKRAMAKGGDVMRAEVMRVVPPLLEQGGFIPGCDHGVPPDISWPNFVDYSRLLADLTGWL